MAVKHNAELPSAEQVRATFDYEPKTGLLRWKRRDDIVSHRSRLFEGRAAGRLEGRGYVQVTWNGRTHQAHRLAWVWVTGQWPAEELDHINGLRSDNRLANLRAASRSQNAWNTTVRRTNTHGFKGVTRHRKTGKWQASIKVSGKALYLGLHKTPEQAHAAYVAASIHHRGVTAVRYDAWGPSEARSKAEAHQDELRGMVRTRDRPLRTDPG